MKQLSNEGVRTSVSSSTFTTTVGEEPETQLQRIVRKVRDGEMLGGSIAIHVNGYNMDLFWKNKHSFMKAIDTLNEQREDLWKMTKELRKAK